jgi:hypothetical protein
VCCCTAEQHVARGGRTSTCARCMQHSPAKRTVQGGPRGIAALPWWPWTPSSSQTRRPCLRVCVWGLTTRKGQRHRALCADGWRLRVCAAARSSTQPTDSRSAPRHGARSCAVHCKAQAARLSSPLPRPPDMAARPAGVRKRGTQRASTGTRSAAAGGRACADASRSELCAAARQARCRRCHGPCTLRSDASGCWQHCSGHACCRFALSGVRAAAHGAWCAPSQTHLGSDGGSCREAEPHIRE